MGELLFIIIQHLGLLSSRVIGYILRLYIMQNCMLGKNIYLMIVGRRPIDHDNRKPKGREVLAPVKIDLRIAKGWG